MDYELAKELKDVGFPNSNEWTFGEVAGEGMQCFYDDGDSIHFRPTLSELINGCGIAFEGLHAPNGIEKSWSAFDRNLSEYGLGSTPKEAVARLWLALNKLS